MSGTGEDDPAGLERAIFLSRQVTGVETAVTAPAERAEKLPRSH